MRYFALISCVALTASFLAAQDGSNMVVDQWAATDQHGSIDAVVVAPAPIRSDARVVVSLGAEDGKIYRAQPRDSSGLNVSFAAIPAGVYTMTVRGPGIAACYAVQVVGGVSDELREAEHIIEISAANVSMDVVSDLAGRYAPAEIASPAPFDMEAARKKLESLANAHVMQVNQSGGGLSGMIGKAGVEAGGAAMTNVMIVQNGQVVAQTVTDGSGQFVIDSLPPGRYSMIAAGADGVAVLGFELAGEMLPAPGLSATNKNGADETFVALQGSGSSMSVQLGPSGLDSPIMQDFLQSSPPAGPAGLPAPPMSGGAGFGGGGAGGGGFGGELLGLAGLGLGAAALASDDDDNISLPPAVSPLNP